MEFNKTHWIGIGISLIVIITSLFLINTKFFFFTIGIGILLGAFPFVFSMIYETKMNTEREEMFLEFTRNLVESVKTGTPISKSIINVQHKPFGALSPHVRKLANQISIGIPLSKALQIFSKDLKNKTISRALTLIGQAEKAGGDIGEILEAVTKAVNMADKLRKERQAAISTLVVQGYIIFIVFIIIILVMQFKIIPMMSGISGIGQIGAIGTLDVATTGTVVEQQELGSSFLYLLLIQGLFSGLAIGKLADGNIKAGIKHSFTLMLLSFLVSTTANLIFGA